MYVVCLNRQNEESAAENLKFTTESRVPPVTSSVLATENVNIVQI